MFARVRGTEDLLDLTLHNFALRKISELLEVYDFSQIQTPILEFTNLFIRSLGTETDVVTKEMYTFNTRSGESICLRPEMTASTIRAFIEANIDKKPWKVFSFGSVFRHERPQKGRWREFSQVNMEVIGTKNIAQDAHFLKMLDRLFSEIFNLNNYVLKINFLGTKEDRALFTQNLYNYLKNIENEICETCKVRKEKNILRVFDCKNENCKLLYQQAPEIVEFLSSESREEWEKLLELLDILSVNYVYDKFLVRGLDYYNKTVFEFVSYSDQLGSQNSFCGGGRWDLAREFGLKHDIPSLGAAIGFGRLILLLEQNRDNLSVVPKPPLTVIIPMNSSLHSLALLLAYDLQYNNICTDIIFEEASISNMLRAANKMGAKYALILGEEEQKNNTITLKNMLYGDQKVIKQSEIIELLK